ncbi:MAG: peptidase [Flavobacteriaceae bacterium]|nr:peptidase [Flavobacteriaceae bacterium]
MFKTEIKSQIDEDICILIKVKNHAFNYICECGEAKKLSVKECQDTKAIFISHTHIDHFVNFDTILRHQIGTGRKVIICGPKGLINQVQHRIKSYCWNLIEEGAISYEIREIHENNYIKKVTLNPPLWEQENEENFSSFKIFEQNEFYVEFEILDHKIDSVSYLFRAKDKTKIELDDGFKGGKWVSDLKRSYEMNTPNKIIHIDGIDYLSKNLYHMINIEKGKKVGIIMDHAATKENHQKIKTKFFKCDEVFIECFYKNEDKEFAKKNYHSYASMSGKIVKESKIKNATPVHFSRKYKKDDIEALLKEFETAQKAPN